MKSDGVHHLAGLLACLALVSIQLHCVEPEEFQGTYQEVRAIPEDRDHAYKLSLFRFGDEVGGVVRFYEIGEYLNTRDNPYFLESYCDYFGPVRLSDDSFRFSVEEGLSDRPYVFQFTSLEPSTIQGQVSILTAGQEEETIRFEFELERVSVPIDRSCTRRAFDFEVTFDRYPIDQYDRLSLAIVFVGYDAQGEPTRSNPSTAYAVSMEQGLEYWSTDERLVPTTPPQEAMSAPNYPTDGAVQYSLGYVVLFNDQTSPGEYWHNVVGDEVVAIALDQVLIYLEEPAEYLDRSVAAVFDDITEVSLGFGVYNVEYERNGQVAVVVSASRKASERIVLEEVSPLDRGLYPALLPSELIE